MAEKIRLQGLTAKIESTYATDSIPTPALDAIQVEDFLWPSIEIGFLQENPRDNLATGFLGVGLAGARAGRFAKLRIPVALKGAGAAYSATVKPEMGVLFRACGHLETIVVVPTLETVAYDPRSLLHESATIYAYGAGRKFRVVGCRGTLAEAVIQPGLITVLVFEISGILVTDPNDEALPAFTYPNLTVLPPAVLAAGLTLNAFDPDDFRTVTFNQNALIEERPGGNAVNGHAGYEINGFSPTLEAVIDSPPLASFNPYTLQAAATAFATDVDVGSAQYNKATLSTPQAQIMALAHQADRGFGVMQLTMRAGDTTAGNDSYKWLFD